jgi:magnesium-transporting ATPase (P-type)
MNQELNQRTNYQLVDRLLWKALFRKSWDPDLLGHFKLSKSEAQVMFFISMMATAFFMVLISSTWRPFHNKSFDLIAFLVTFFVIGRFIVPVMSLGVLRITKGLPRRKDDQSA